MQKLLTFFSKIFSLYAIFNDQSCNDTLTNNIVSFEQLGPGQLEYVMLYITLRNFSVLQFFKHHLRLFIISENIFISVNAVKFRYYEYQK